MRPPPTYRRGHPPTLGWASLVVLLLLVELGQGDNVYCEHLKKDTDRAEWFTCIENPIKLAPINDNTEYPIFKISDFNDQEYTDFTTVKDSNLEPTRMIRTFVGNLICSGSSLSKITKLSFKVPNENISQSVLLENNLKLTKVEFSTELIKSNGTIKFTVANNRLLSPESIEHLKSLNYTSEDSYIQEFGECVIESGAQISFKDLENCHYVKGNLVINKGTDTTSEFPATLKDIRGCISIKSTDLTNLNFLKIVEKSNCSGTHEITDNKNLCIHPEEYSRIIEKFKKRNNKIVIEKNNGCKGECTWKYLHEKKDKKCLIITKTVTLSKTKESDNLTYLSQVEEIRGRLVIQYTELSSIDMFPNLHTVSIKEKDSAIYIARNTKLISFDFPALKNITSVDSSVKVFVMNNNNPNFTVEDDQYERFRKLTDGWMTMPLKQPPPPIVVLPEDEEKDGKSVKKLSEKEELGIIIGISSAIVFVVILLVVVIVTFVICYNKWKKRMEEQRRIDENERMELDIATNKTIFYYL